MSDLLKTPLYDRHLALGAKMAPFAGFEMPIQYSGIIAEHKQARERASVFDICHMGEFMLSGPDALSALSKAVTHDLQTLAPGKCRYGFLLNPKGGVLDDLIVYRLGADSFMLVVNGARRASDFAWLGSLLPDGLDFEDVSDDTAKIDLQGPKSLEVLEALFPGAADFRSIKYFNFIQTELMSVPVIVSRTGYTGELGYELYLRADKAGPLWDLLLSDERVLPCGLGARDTLRLEMGYPLYGQDLDENHTPAEAGYEFMLKSQADYVGKGEDRKVRERLIPLLLEGRRSARSHDPVFLPSGREVGQTASGSFSPSLGRALALAYVAADAADESEFVIKAARAEIKAQKVELPFYKQGTARIKL